jgi:hypothetical protein
MPCYLKQLQREREALKKVMRQKGKLPTKNEVKLALTELLKRGEIAPMRYSQLISLVDACVEEKGHTHVHSDLGAWTQ